MPYRTSVVFVILKNFYSYQNNLNKSLEHTWRFVTAAVCATVPPQKGLFQLLPAPLHSLLLLLLCNSLILDSCRLPAAKSALLASLSPSTCRTLSTAEPVGPGGDFLSIFPGVNSCLIFHLLSFLYIVCLAPWPSAL